MSASRVINQRMLRTALPVAVLGFAFVTACVEDEPGIGKAGAGSAGKQATADAGSDSVAGSPQDVGGAATAGSSTTQAGTSAMSGGTGGETPVENMGGAPIIANEGGQAGEGDGESKPKRPACHAGAPALDRGLHDRRVDSGGARSTSV